MGVQARVVVYTPDTPSAENVAQSAFERLAALEQVMSDYRPTSELAVLNARSGRGPETVSQDLWEALGHARNIAAATSGAFDPTIGPLVHLWRQSRSDHKLPDSALIADAKAKTGFQFLTLDGVRNTADLRLPGMAIDLGGIGKGFAAQEAVKLLKSRGVGSCMVALSGDIAVGDAPPGTPGWKVAIETGYADGRANLNLVNASVSTAGDLEQFVEIDGVRYSHIIDPATGLGSTRRAAACVVASDGALADGLDTALAVLGVEKGRAVLGAFPMAKAMIVEPNAGGVNKFVSPEFPVDGGATFNAANEPPAGFTALFNGTDLANWQGLIDGGPAYVAAMPAAERAKQQAAADKRMREHWRAENGVLVFDGKGDSLQTAKDYKNFELYVDWNILKEGDSGIYLRGAPQVQIWDNPIGSGGLYNNEKHLSRPLAFADRKPGEWNRLHIIMRGERVTVYLNDVLVVDDVPLENYWERDKPIHPMGPIELQNHGAMLKFRNIFIKELADPAPPTDQDKRMAWWRDARFGMFIHWGLYSIPAGEWNGKVYDSASEWLMNTAKISPQDYEKLAPKFNPVKFDAIAWADIARNAGMRYVVITTKHHDGFCNFDSTETTYDIMDATPFKRDIMKELSEAVRGKGLAMCWYHSIMDWHQPDANMANWSKYAPVLRKQVEEILTKYGKIGVLWFDGEWEKEWTTDQGKAMYELCRKLQPEIIVNNRVGKGRAGMAGLTKEGDHPGDFGTPEQEVPRRGVPGTDWESCMTMNESWGYHRTDTKWKSAQQLIRTLAETASKGGNFLLNVGPTELGEIPSASVERLRAMGAWMNLNSPSIYGTVAGPFDRLPWGRCTMKEEPNGSTLYLHVFEWPKDGTLEVPGLMNEVRRAYLLADPKQAVFATRSASGIALAVPKKAPDANDSVVVLELAGRAAVVSPTLHAAPDGSLTLNAIDADTHGSAAAYEADEEHRCIGMWTNAKDWVSWDYRIDKPGRYKVEVEWACEEPNAGSHIKIEAGTSSVEMDITSTGKWTKFEKKALGTLTLPAGRGQLKVTPTKMAKDAVMNLRTIRLVPE